MPDNSKIEVVNLSELVLPTGLIKKIPPALMKKYQFIPISLKDNVLACAFGELPEANTISDIEFATAYKIRIALASRGEIQSRLKELFPEPEPQPEPVPEPEPESKPKSVSRLSKLYQMKSKSLVFSSGKRTKLLIMAGGGLVIILAVVIGFFVFSGKGNDENKKQAELSNLKNQNQELMTKINELEQKINSSTSDKNSSAELQQKLLEELKALKEEKEELASKIKQVEKEKLEKDDKEKTVTSFDNINLEEESEKFKKLEALYEKAESKEDKEKIRKEWEKQMLFLDKITKARFSEIINKFMEAQKTGGVWAGTEFFDNPEMASGFFAVRSWEILGTNPLSNTATVRINSSNKGGMQVTKDWAFYMKIKGNDVKIALILEP